MRLIRPLLGVALLAGLFAFGYAVMLRAIPTIVTDQLFRQFFAAGRPLNDVAPARLRTARRNLVVMDNPDTITRSIIYDVADRPLLVDMTVPVGLEYWSVSVFANNTDTLFIANDRQTGPGRFRIAIRKAGQAVPAGIRSVVSPSDRGFIIFRGVTRDRTDPADVERTKAAMADVTARPL